MAGAPGSRKSGLALQLALDRATAGGRTLFLLTEESAGRVRDRAERLLAGCTASVRAAALSGVAFEPALEGGPMRHAERLLLRPDAPYRGVGLVVLDSIQGGAAAAGADADACRVAIELARLLADRGIATLLIGHVTKTNLVRGPRSLEHAVDVVLLLDRRGGRRTLTVPKNRFGPARLRPLHLAVDPATTRLVAAPHAEEASVASVRAYLPSVGLVEVQAAATLAASGAGRLTCRGLPREELRHVIACLGRGTPLGPVLRELDLSVAVRAAGGVLSTRDAVRDAALLHLPVAVAVLAACLGRSVDPNVVAVGELDLVGRTFGLPPRGVPDLVAALRAGELRGTRLLCPTPLTALLPWNAGCTFLGVDGTAGAAARLWPGLDLAEVAAGS